MTREELIRDGLNKWHTAKFHGILEFATGVGKTYAAILAIEHFIEKYSDEEVLIVCPTHTILRNFKGEFYKFKKQKLIKSCRFICYASIAKQKGPFSLVILDEIHHVTTDKKMNFIKQGKYRGLLGLSASLTAEQKLLLAEEGVKVVAKCNLKEAQEHGFISNHTIFNLPVELTPEERDNYNSLTDSISYAWFHYHRRAWNKINERAEILYGATNKEPMIQQISDLFTAEYGLVFTLRQKLADKYADMIGKRCVSMHSGKTKKQNAAAYKVFLDGRTKTNMVATPKIFDEGVTVPRVSFGILAARYSKSRQFKQTAGRHVRDEWLDKHAIMIRLYCKDTKEEDWLETSQVGFSVQHVESYEELEEIVKGIRSAA